MTREDAQLGALLEAIESDAAERYDAPTIDAAWQDLPASTRPEFLEDFAHVRTQPPAPGEGVAWVEAIRPDGMALMVPMEAVSLDFTRWKDSRFEQSSAGLATGTTQDEARRSALLELIERDAVSRFLRARFSQRLAREIDADSVDFDWFGELHDRISGEGLDLRLFAPASPTGVPVFAAVLIDEAKNARPYGGTVGHAAHPVPQWALFKAVSEAIQSRLTFIAGSRDDCWPWDYLKPQTGMVTAIAPPPNAAIDSIDFAEIDPGPSGLDQLCDALTSSGVGQLAFVSIAEPEGFSIVRAFAPGLGTLANEARL